MYGPQVMEPDGPQVSARDDSSDRLAERVRVGSGARSPLRHEVVILVVHAPFLLLSQLLHTVGVEQPYRIRIAVDHSGILS